MSDNYQRTSSLAGYCGAAFVVAALPAFLVVGALNLAAMLGIDTSRIPTRDGAPSGGIMDVIGATLVSPLVETFAIAAVIYLTRGWTKKIYVRAAIAAVVMAFFHGLVGGPLWFFGVLWSFFVFSYGFVLWWPQSFSRGYAAAAIPHALLNGVLFLF